MSPQETQTLQDFLGQLTQVRGIAKDPQADAMITAAVAQQPDAAYLLVQRALLMEQALAASKAQVAALESQVQALTPPAAPAPGFFDSNAWGHAPAAPVRSSSPSSPSSAPMMAPAYTSAPAAAPAQAFPQSQASAAPAPGFFGGGMGSMLGTVAATAAGVAGGAFLYQGIEHLMNGNGSAHQNAAGTPTEKVENTTVNNYYGSDADKASLHASNDGDQQSSSSQSSQDTDSSNDLSDLANFDIDDIGGDDSMV